MKHAFICINGILNNPGDAEGWTDRAVTWLHLRTGVKAEKFEYATGALTRRLRQQWRAEAIAKMARFYFAAGFEVSFMAHSNGGDLFERVLDLLREDFRNMGWKVRSAHLFAPASDGTEAVRALRDGDLGTLFLYGSTADKALALAAQSRRWFGWVGLGYGDLGRRIPAFAAGHADLPVIAHNDDTQEHGTWFTRGPDFEATMRRVARNESLHP